MSGIRLVVGVIVMGIAVPLTLFLLLDLSSVSQLLTIAATTVLAWGVAYLLGTILERPRIQGTSPGTFRQDLERGGPLPPDHPPT